MKDAFIHIGYPKTASTFIQNQILKESAQISPHSISTYTANQETLRTLTFNQETLRMLTFKDNVKVSNSERDLRIKKLLSMCRDDDRPLVLSWEAFSMGGWALKGNAFGEDVTKIFDNPTNIARRLKKYFPRAVIIIVLRPQYDWIQSWWRYNIRGLSEHSVLSLRELMKTKFWHENIYPYLRYNQLIRIYSGLFGRENVKVFFLRELSNNPVRFARDFCSTIGIDAPEIRSGRLNASHSHLHASVRMHLNRWYFKISRALLNEESAKKIDRQYFYLMKRYFGKLDLVLHHFSRRSSLDKQLFEDINRLFLDDNKDLQSMLGVDIIQYGFKC